MKRYLKAIGIVVVVIVIAVWVIDKIPFTKAIDMQFEPTIYVSGEYVDKTTVIIKGEKTRYLFRDDSFIGEIRIAYLEKTNVDGLQAKIRWHDNDDLQSISFYYNGDFFSAQKYGITTSLIMEDDMRNFAFMTTGGEIISTAHVYCNILDEYAGLRWTP